MQSEAIVTKQVEESAKVNGIYARAHLVILGRDYYRVKSEENFVRIEAGNTDLQFLLSVSNGPALKALIEDLTALYQESEN